MPESRRLLASQSLTLPAFRQDVPCSRRVPSGSSSKSTSIALSISLLRFTADFLLCGVSGVGNLMVHPRDPLLEFVPAAIAGSVIAFVYGKIR